MVHGYTERAQIEHPIYVTYFFDKSHKTEAMCTPIAAM